MGDVGGLFTDRRAALEAAQRLLDGDGRARVLVFTGVSGMGKSTLLARVAAPPLPGSCVRLLDAASLRAGMAAKAEGGEQAALVLLRQLGAALAAGAPWWRRRWAVQQAEAIGIPRTWSVRVWQWASRGAVIVDSPVTVTAGTLTQGERRAGWVRDLLAVARAVRRRRCVLLMDTCEWLMYFDDIQAERHRPEQPLGVGGWFAGVLEQVIDRAPRLRVVLAGTAVPDSWREDTDSGRYELHELTPWTAADTRAYLSRRGLPGPEDLAGVLTERSQGMPAEIAWIADALTGVLLDDAAVDGTSATGAVAVDLEELARGDRQDWLRTHVMARISDRNKRFLQAAAVLGPFTPQALHTVAFGPGSPPQAGNDDWFEPLSRMSCIRELPGTPGQWQLHRTIRDWLLAALTEDDTHRVPNERTLPQLHSTAAEYHEALAEGAFSVEAAHHRFALGDNRHTASWTQALARALRSDPVDGLYLQLLTDGALAAPAIRHTLPIVYADANLTRAHLASTRGDHTTAYEHADLALTAYREGDHPGVRAATLLAGQAAWRRSHYAEAATHWTTALETLQTDDPLTGELLCALAEALVNTGDFPRAEQLLADARRLTEPTAEGSEPPAEPHGSTQTFAVCDALPLPPLADAVPARLREAHLHRLSSQVAACLSEWSRSADQADLALERADHDPHITAHVHRLHAERAIFAWDLYTADQHVKAGFTAARNCPDQRCMALLQLTRASLAEQKATWAPSPSADRVRDDSSTVTTVPPRTSPLPTTSLSVTARAEAVHQQRLAQDARVAAHAIATELRDIQTLAHTQSLDHSAEALDLYRSTGDRHGQANALRNLASIARRRGDLETAQQHSADALALYRSIGSRLGQANALDGLAHIARLQGDLETAQQHSAEALALSRSIGNRHGQANALDSLAVIVRLRGDLETAQQHAAEALALSRSIGNRHGQANALDSLAVIVRLRGDLETAQQHAAEALALSRSIGNRHGQANALDSLADIVRLRGDLETAQQHAVEALALYRSIGARHGQANALRTLGIIVRLRGDLETAQQHATDAQALYRSIGSRLGQANALHSLAAIARQRDDLETAQQHATDAQALYRSIGDRHGQANALDGLADIVRLRGDLETAQQHAADALALYRSIGARHGQADALDSLANIARLRGDADSARRMFGEAAALYEEIGAGPAADYCRRRQREL
ncbi:tetratricopeptide repeat protein [Streptomyces sp. NPDC002889]|uniref:tetratricopeptide repeat protein n=1 Tax=Streptomyces sp. NPDC002889 TaxID=3364669 RepID=UPI0036995E1F